MDFWCVTHPEPLFEGPTLITSKLFSHLFYIMFYYQSIKAINPTIVAVIMVAVNLVLFPASIVTGLMITRFGSFYGLFGVGWQ